MVTGSNRDTLASHHSVIKIILQFCKENSLTESFNAIQVCVLWQPTLHASANPPQNECKVSLNTVDSLETFLSDINNGRWDIILPQMALLKLPRRKLEDLYEQVCGFALVRLSLS